MGGWMCKHVFTKWIYVAFDENHYDHEEWYQRICTKCGYVEELDVESYEELLRKEDKWWYQILKK
jgi:hypothetical protein